MPKWSRAQYRQMKEKVRSILVRKPRASQFEIAEILKISNKTAWKLKNEIIEENTKRVSEEKVNEAIGKLEAENDDIALQCWEILSKDTRTIQKKNEKGEIIEEIITITTREKIEAMKTLIQMKTQLFNIKFDAGVFSRKLGELNTTDKNDLIDLLKKADESIRQAIIDNFIKIIKEKGN